MRHAAANALRSAYFQRDMVNCDPIATKAIMDCRYWPLYAADPPKGAPVIEKGASPDSAKVAGWAI